MLEKSCLYISDYIERNKDTYYDVLTRVRTHNDIIGWIKFFLEVVIETSKTAKIVVVIYSHLINKNNNIWLSSLVPVIGFTLSTVSLNLVRTVWEKNRK